MSWPRERVLTEYLHRIHYGNLMTGCTSAASGYFNKPLRDLTLAECAFLAAIHNHPHVSIPSATVTPSAHDSPF